ncbi:MAG TPA: hypothetical protein VGI33_15855 [Paenibacillus sp.]
MEELRYKLRKAELLLTGQLEQQLVESYVLLVVKSYTGCTTIDLRITEQTTIEMRYAM